MSRLRIMLTVSLLLLVVSNILWALRLSREESPVLPTSYGCTETEQYVETREGIVRPLAAAINASLTPGATQQSILAAATDTSIQHEHLTCVVDSDSRIGQVSLGLRFDGDRLVAVSTEVCTQYRP